MKERALPAKGMVSNRRPELSWASAMRRAGRALPADFLCKLADRFCDNASDHPVVYSGFLQVLLECQCVPSAIRLSQMLLAHPPSRHAHDMIMKAFVRTGHRFELRRLFSDVALDRLRSWVLALVSVSDRPVPAIESELSPEAKDHIASRYGHELIANLSGLLVGINDPASETLGELAIRVAIDQPQDVHGLDMRNYALRDLATIFSEEDRLAIADACFSQMRKSGGDGANHGDWCRAVSDLGICAVRCGQEDRARLLIAGLNSADGDERRAAGRIGAAFVRSAIATGDIRDAWNWLNQIADPGHHSSASAELAGWHLENGQMREAAPLLMTVHPRQRAGLIIRSAFTFHASLSVDRAIPEGGAFAFTDAMIAVFCENEKL
jgi:hypothetical protein